VEGLKFAKSVRTNTMNYLSSNSERVEGCKLSAGGIPSCLGPLRKRVIEQNPVILRFVLTLLTSTRALKSEAFPDIESIIAPSKRGLSYLGISLYSVDF
jgi:hypothetical protein